MTRCRQVESEDIRRLPGRELLKFLPARGERLGASAVKVNENC